MQRFDTFHLAGSNLNLSEVEGVGIGLSTAYSLSRFMGGDLNVHSIEKNRGHKSGTTATFSVLFTSLQGCATFEHDLEWYLQNFEKSLKSLDDQESRSIFDFAKFKL